MITRNFKQSITTIPAYNDGIFYLYKIIHTDTVHPIEELELLNKDPYYYNELSLSDYIIFENEKREKEIKLKIRISQERDIDSNNVLGIDNVYYKVFNVFHFKNKDGFLESDITLEEYTNPIIKEDTTNE